ncbi:oxygen-insensitive NADPH nitroreductase [Bacillus sp. Marseille-P3661]|uniref:oxygen-insensitive NADPH nitroreductase n=1 Tax=Bacillus sp. Marseille-P3661 TaxID=1936234 RepID=UPI000C84C0FD|nr:oxygen-insensitive NADPH nitroreductase [Bacillus sp. Marseille-P3661]
MNETIRLLQNHRSIRKFTDEPISPELMNEIFHSAQMASTSTNMQAYSVIAVTNPELKTELSVLTGNQKHVEQCPIYLVWCADLNRLKITCELNSKEPSYLNSMENFIVANVDTALAAQNAAIAAESAGLGVVFVGGVRNRIREVTKLLNIPELVFPLFGMCLGYPVQQPIIRPRLPLEVVVHNDYYQDEHFEKYISEYDNQIEKYMMERTRGKRNDKWSDIMTDKLSHPIRMHMSTYIEEQGFKLE